MDFKTLFRQMIDFNKAAFTNTFNAMDLLQDQAEKMMNTFLSQAGFVPKEYRKLVGDWVASCRKARDEFKQAIEEGFERLEGAFADEETAQPQKTAKAQAKSKA